MWVWSLWWTAVKCCLYECIRLSRPIRIKKPPASAERMLRGQRSHQRSWVFHSSRACFTLSAQVIAEKCEIDADWSERPWQLVCVHRPWCSVCVLDWVKAGTDWTQRTMPREGFDIHKCYLLCKRRPHLTCKFNQYNCIYCHFEHCQQTQHNNRVIRS